MKKQGSYEEILQQMAAFCSIAERCEHDVKDKLKKTTLSNAEILKILQYLKAEKYIDEQRFCNAFVRDKFKFGKWGRIKIAYALKQKNIEEMFISNALNLIDEEQYIEVLSNLMQQKARSLISDSDYEKKGKMFRFAQSRGFETSLIYKLLSKTDL